MFFSVLNYISGSYIQGGLIKNQEAQNNLKKVWRVYINYLNLPSVSGPIAQLVRAPDS